MLSKIQSTIQLIKLKSLLIIGAVFFAGGVFADTGALQYQDIMNATPVGDLSRILWRSIFGEFSDNPFVPGSASVSLLGSLFVLFNTLIFSVGIIWLSYGVGSAIMGTASDGEALGRRVNTSWYPVRVTVGVAGMVPIFSGFTGSQAIIMWLCTLGIGMANMLWSAAIDNPANPLAAIGTPVINNPVGVDDVTEKMILANVCYIMYQAHHADLPDSKEPPLKEWNGRDLVLRYGSTVHPNMCGTFKILQNNELLRSEDSVLGFRAGAVDYKSIGNGMLVGYQNALTVFQDKVHTESVKWVTKYQESLKTPGGYSPQFDFEYIKTIQKEYRIAVNAGVANAKEINKNAITSGAKQNMHAYGWMSAGAWFATFGEVNTAINEAVKSISIQSTGPTAEVGSYGTVKDALESLEISLKKAKVADGDQGDGSSNSDVSKAVRNFGCGPINSGIISASNAVVSGANAVGGVGGSAIGSIAQLQGTIAANSNTQTGNCSMGQGIVTTVISGLSSQGSATIAGLPMVNPVIMFKNIGDYAMTFSSVIIIGQVAGKAATMLPGSGSVISGVVGTASKFGFLEPLKELGAAVMTIAWTLLVVGLIMSLYIPLIPFIVWMGACLSYAASFIEGLIAMPLHSFSHLDTDGEGLGQKTGHGYLFMLNTLTRPSLMVMSFFIASSLVVIMGTFQAALFIPAMNNMQGNSVTGMFSIIGLILIFLVINVTLINACFELINLIPDQVIGFIGAGSVNTRLGSDTEGKINGIFLNVARGAHGGLAGAMKPADEDKGTKLPKLK